MQYMGNPSFGHSSFPNWMFDDVEISFPVISPLSFVPDINGLETMVSTPMMAEIAVVSY